MKPCFRPSALPILTAMIMTLGPSAIMAPSCFAQSSAPGSASVARTVEATATVESVDPKTRQVLLHLDDGQFVTMVAPPEVKNFAQIKPGDHVHARYEAALVARIGQPGHTLLSDQDFEDAGSAPLGRKPGAIYSRESRRKVKITAIDLTHNTVSFIGPTNVERTAMVRTPQMQAFLKTLKVGDDVDVVFRESALLEVHAAQ
jgi:Cu/Ag efflux protein CusF